MSLSGRNKWGRTCIFFSHVRYEAAEGADRSGAALLHGRYFYFFFVEALGALGGGVLGSGYFLALATCVNVGT
jgi:hypothetical protein